VEKNTSQEESQKEIVRHSFQTIRRARKLNNINLLKMHHHTQNAMEHRFLAFCNLLFILSISHIPFKNHEKNIPLISSGPEFINGIATNKRPHT